MTNDELERRLSGLFAFAMPADHVAAVHERIAAAATLAAPRRRIGPARDRLFRGLVLAILLTLLLGAVAVGSLELLERVASDTEPGYQAA